MKSSYKVTQIQYRIAYALHHCLLAVAFFLPLSAYLTNIFLGLSAVMWMAKMVATRDFCWKASPLNLLMGIFIFISAFSITFSPDRWISGYNYLYLMGRYMLVYYLVINNFTTREHITELVYAMLASSAAVSLYGFYQYAVDISMLNAEWVDSAYFPELKTRVFSTLYNPNILASYLVTMISLAFGVFLKASGKKIKVGLVLLISCLALCLLFTYSRGAWLTLVAIIGLCGVFYNRKVLWLLVLLPIGMFFAHDSVVERIMSIVNPTDTSSVLRLALWESTLAMITDHPLTGIGWNAYQLVYPEYNFFIEDESTIIYHAHNMYLNFAAELGLIGLVVFLALIYFHMKININLCTTSSDKFIGGLSLGITAAYWGIIISGITDHVLFNLELSMLFWLINAISVVLWRIEYLQFV